MYITSCVQYMCGIFGVLHMYFVHMRMANSEAG